jgi:hypothetical protein
MADPNHDRHAELKEWYDADFDPNALNVLAIQQHLSDLAKRWSGSKQRRNSLERRRPLTPRSLFSSM